jgi:hypothetical protein
MYWTLVGLFLVPDLAKQHVRKKSEHKLTSHKDGCPCLCLVFYLSRSQVSGPLALTRSGSWSGAGGASVHHWRTRPAWTPAPTSWESCSGGWSSECTRRGVHAEAAPAPCPGQAPTVTPLQNLPVCSSIAHWQAKPRIAPACDLVLPPHFSPLGKLHVHAQSLSRCDPSPPSSVVAGGLLQPPGRRPWRSYRASTTAPLWTR